MKNASAVRWLGAPLVAACLLASHPATAAASWILDADAGLVYETNVGLAQKSPDKKDDVAFATALSTGWAFPLDDRNIFSLTGDLSGAAYAELHGLSHFAAGLTPAFRTKFGLGREAPWLRLWGSAARLEFQNSVRDGWRYRLGAGVGKRFGDRLTVRLDYTFEDRLADHGRVVSRLPGDVFDTTSHTYAARVDVAVTDVLTLFTGYAWRQGDVVSTTRRNTEIFNGSTALTRDPVFGPDFFAYRIDATVHSLTFGMSLALGERSSVNVSYERHIGIGPAGLDYSNDVVRAGVLFSY